MSKRLAVVGWLGAFGAVLGASACLFDYAGAERCANENGGGCPDMSTSSSSMTSSSSSMPSSCRDGKQDDGEVDEDCGGKTSCPRCATGKRCKLGSDCASAVCDQGACAPIRYTTHWSTISSSAPPPARYGAGIAARPDGTILVHGGVEAADDGVDTWELGAGAWMSGVATGAPAKRHFAPMAFHEGLNKALLAGGYPPSGGPLSDTAWYGAAGWSVGPKLPHTRYGSTLVYDRKRDALLLFAGDTSTGLGNDVLELQPDPPNPLTWTSKTAAGPAKRMYHAAAFDDLNDRMVIFGGEDRTQKPVVVFPDTWEYFPATTTWHKLTGAGPTPVYGASMAYDSHRKVIVLYGGRDVQRAYFDTWELDGQSWTKVEVSPPALTPSPRIYHASMAYDAIGERMVLVGGDFHSAPVVGTFEYLAYGDPCPEGQSQCKYGQCKNGVCCFVDGDCPNQGVCNTPGHPGMCAASGM